MAGVRAVLLTVHVAAGSAALLLAARVLLGGVRQHWGGGRGRAYGGCVAVLAGTALALTGPGSTLPGAVRGVLAVLAVATVGAARRGLALSRGTAAHDVRPAALRLLWGSVTSLVSALAVVSAPPVLWVVVIAVGTAVTERSRQHSRGWPPLCDRPSAAGLPHVCGPQDGRAKGPGGGSSRGAASAPRATGGSAGAGTAPGGPPTWRSCSRRRRSASTAAR